MREILFRGKRIDNGEWVDGCLLVYGRRCFIIPNEELLESEAEARFYWRLLEKHFEVDPDTVGQYTGLLDKNGKRIFEGDILQSAMFEYSKNRAAVMAERYNCGCCHLVYGFSTCSDDVDIGRKSKIVGNIYDNPELLEDNT